MVNNFQSVINQLNSSALQLLTDHEDKFAELGIERHSIPGGGVVFDFGVGRAGKVDAGVLLARICLGDLATVNYRPAGSEDSVAGLATVEVKTDQPLAACMASQYAGWPFSHEKYFAMCSGPVRAVRGKEELLEQYGLVVDREEGRSAGPVVAVFESNQLPGEGELKKFASSCGVDPQDVTICIARTASNPGTVQVVARSMETAIHKLHELGFDLRKIVSGSATAPVPPIPHDDLTALGWTNDAVLYGGVVELVVDCDETMIAEIGPKVPSSSSVDYGEPFLATFQKYDCDFYKVDKMLFSPAQIKLTCQQTSNSFSFGELREDVLQKSFGLN